MTIYVCVFLFVSVKMHMHMHVYVPKIHDLLMFLNQSAATAEAWKSKCLDINVTRGLMLNTLTPLHGKRICKRTELLCFGCCSPKTPIGSMYICVFPALRTTQNTENQISRNKQPLWLFGKEAPLKEIGRASCRERV